MEYQFSTHALQQMLLRSISKDIVENVLRNPDQKNKVEDLTVFQSIINTDSGEVYLLRVFVNEKRDPKLIVTVYKTTKIQKYYEGQIW